MTQDEIICMAREAKIFHAYDSEYQWDGITNETLLGSDESYSDRYRNNRIIEILAPFAALVAAHAKQEYIDSVYEQHRETMFSNKDLGMLVDAVKAEREACAKVAERFEPDEKCDYVEYASAAIRARGKK